MSTAILPRSLTPNSNDTWRDTSATYTRQRRSSFSSQAGSMAPICRLVTVQEVLEYQPIEGLLVIESDSEDEMQGERIEEKGEQSEIELTEEASPKKSSKPLPRIPEQEIILNFPPFPEPVIRPTMLTPITEYNTEDDTASIPWSEDVWSQQDTSTGKHQEKEQVDVSNDDYASRPEPEYFGIRFDEKTAMEPEPEDLIDSEQSEDATSEEKSSHEHKLDGEGQTEDQPCRSDTSGVSEASNDAAMQKPFEPAGISETARATPVDTKDFQPPHTPEESMQPTIWSVDDAESTAGSEKSSKPRELETLAPPPPALSPSPSLCSRCSSISGLMPMQNGQSDSVPSSATSVVSTQDLLKAATNADASQGLNNNGLARPPSAQSYNERPNSMYVVSSMQYQQEVQPQAPERRRPLSAAWDSLTSLPLSSSPQPHTTAGQQPTSFVQEVRRLAAIQKSQPAPNIAPTPSPSQSKSRLSIASFSLTHNKDAIKTYRRMASKTKNMDIQMTYAKYLLEIARLYGSSDKKGNNETRERLLSEAGYWIDRLAKHGKAEALYIKGKWHMQPDKEDCAQAYQRPQPLKAFKCLQAAAKAGWVEAYYDLARYRKARGEYNQAVTCYKIASSKGHTLATYKMAKILLRGQLQQKRDIRRGLEYLRTAADSPGPDSAEPAYVLSCVYTDELERIGIARDSQMSRENIPLGMQYLEKAVSLGLPSALHRMGQINEQGLFGRPRDPWQGYLCFTRAAEDGHEGAMLDLSRIYTRGIPGHLMPQHEMAFKWCQRAADKGLAQAEFVLGTYYEMGVGTISDYAKALEYYGKAASKGYSPAAEKLNLPISTSVVNPLKRASDKHDSPTQLPHLEPTGADCKIM